MTTGISTFVECTIDSLKLLYNRSRLALLIQLSPSMQIVEVLDALRNINPYLDNRLRYAVEVRHRFWFQDPAYSFPSNSYMCLVWIQLMTDDLAGKKNDDDHYVNLIKTRQTNLSDFL
jgi:uncharacterized protein YecE (DUF72 family)